MLDESEAKGLSVWHYLKLSVGLAIVLLSLWNVAKREADKNEQEALRLISAVIADRLDRVEKRLDEEVFRKLEARTDFERFLEASSESQKR